MNNRNFCAVIVFLMFIFASIAGGGCVFDDDNDRASSNNPNTTTQYHIVKFDSNGGSDVPSQRVISGEKVIKPTDPVREGYIFQDWNIDKELTNKFDFDTSITKDLTLYAKWQSEPPTPVGFYSVIFNSNGGNPVPLQTVSSGEKATEPAIPVKEGYIFQGWYVDPEFHTRFDFTTIITQNITLYAKWEVQSAPATRYTIMFNSNGGSPVENQTVVSGEKALKPSAPTREGYTFQGWYIDLEFIELFDFESPITKDITLYAKWEALSNPVIMYTVTFNSNGGSEVSSLEVSSGSTISAPENPTKEGYVFAGWYKDEGLSEIFIFGTDGDKITQDITLYAYWLDADLLVAEYAASEIIIGYANGDNPKHVTKNLTLPAKIYSADIVWVSSSGAVSSNGTITRQDNDVNVTLTATAMYNGKSAEAKTFKVKIIRKRTREITEIAPIPIEEASSGDVSIERNESGDVTDIEGQYVSFDIQNADDALDAITVLRDELGIRSPDEELETFLVTSDAYSSEYAFSQVHNGVRAWGRKLVVSANSENKGDFLHSSFLSSDVVARADNKNDIGQNSAETIAKNHYGEEVEVEVDTRRTEKVLYSLNGYEDNPVYAYIIRVFAYSENHQVDESIFVNANTGEVIETIPNSSTAFMTKAKGDNEFGKPVSFDVTYDPASILSYVMYDSNLHIRMFSGFYAPFLFDSTLMGFSVKSANNTWLDKHQVSVYSNMREIMQWWKIKFSRNSLDGNGSDVRVIAHAVGGKDNAEWKPSPAHILNVFDKSDSTSFDHFCGAAVDFLTHETTHAVFEYTVGDFFTKNATGAISEAYADVFACIKDENWMFAEDLFDKNNRYNLSCDRNIADPTSKQSRTRYFKDELFGSLNLIYDDYIKNKADSGNDQNHVHARSFKVSHAAYLMHESNDANGLTWKELGNIWYKSMHKGLDATSRFEDVQRCVLEAAKEVLPKSSQKQKLDVIKSAFSQLGYGSKATLTGIITGYDTGLPVFDAQIEARVGKTFPKTTWTDESGHFSVDIPEGNCSIKITHADYTTFEGNMKLSRGGNVLNVQLVRPNAGSITGKIVAYAIPAKPIKDVTLKIRRGWNNQDSTPILTTTTDSNGKYTLNLGSNGAGYYTIEMSKDGKKGIFNVTVSGNTNWQDEYLEGVDPVVISPDIPISPDVPISPDIPIALDDVPIDEEHFPDEDFRYYVTRFDTDRNEILSKIEISKVTSMDLGFEIESLQGIEYFPMLNELKLRSYQSKSLDVSNNVVLRNLRHLSIEYNCLTQLNVNGCTNLEFLNCRDNLLTNLDLSGCTALKYLDCSENRLSSLDITGHTALETLNCEHNYLKYLILHGCTSLKTLKYYGRNSFHGRISYDDSNDLEMLDIGGCTSLEEINHNNVIFTTSLYAKDCISLKSLRCEAVNLLDVSGCIALEKLLCDGEVKVINMSNCTALQTWQNSGNGYLSALDASNCTSLETLNCHDESLIYLNVNGCTSLEKILCYGNLLDGLDLSSCLALQTLDCRDNKITTLDLSNCPLLLPDNTRYDEGVVVTWPSDITQSVSNTISKNIMDTNDNSIIVAVLPDFQAERTGTYSFDISFDRTVPTGSTLIFRDESGDLKGEFFNDKNQPLTMPTTESLDHVKVSATFESGKTYSTAIAAKNDEHDLSGGTCNVGTFGVIIMLIGLTFAKKY